LESLKLAKTNNQPPQQPQPDQQAELPWQQQLLQKIEKNIDENQPSRTHPYATHINHACNTGRILQQVPDEEGHTTSNMTINHNHVSTKQHFHAIG
ncbi:hypothetical protein ACFPVT_02820, partial [Corynebacterium choanae]|uniref:hypothetical protein n=1 Tax=Corynebacterium choanae TaxID=1862358 RepID=UPI00361BCF72